MKTITLTDRFGNRARVSDFTVQGEQLTIPQPAVLRLCKKLRGLRFLVFFDDKMLECCGPYDAAIKISTNEGREEPCLKGS